MGAGGGEMGSYSLEVTEFLFGVKKVLETDSDGYTTG